MTAVPGATSEESAMDGWWTAVESDLMTCLKRRGQTTPADVGLALGISEAAAMSLLAMLVTEGKVRISLVELPE
jgi:hypothetical protein